MKKNENKEKEAGTGPFKKNSRVKLLLLGLSLLKVRRFQFGLFFYLFQIFLLNLFLSVALSNIFDGTVWPDGFYSFRYMYIYYQEKMSNCIQNLPKSVTIFAKY